MNSPLPTLVVVAARWEPEKPARLVIESMYAPQKGQGIGSTAVLVVLMALLLGSVPLLTAVIRELGADFGATARARYFWSRLSGNVVVDTRAGGVGWTAGWEDSEGDSRFVRDGCTIDVNVAGA